MDYNRIAHFVRVVKSGSFTAAASELGLPKSSVSRSVSQLEEDLGVRLLQRTTRKLSLTDAGQSFYDSVHASVSAINEADATVREHGAAPRGVVRLTAAPDIGFLASVLAQFSLEYPGIRLEVVLTSRYVDLVAEGIDLAVRAGRLEDSSLVARRIGSAELALMASPAYLHRRGVPKSISDLATHDWVLYRAVNGRAAIQLTGPEGTLSIEASANIVADDLAFCRFAIEAGAGIGLLPIQMAVPGLIARKLERVLPAWTHGEAPLHVVLPSASHVPARVALLRDYLVEHLGKQLATMQQRCEKARKEERRGRVPAAHADGPTP